MDNTEIKRAFDAFEAEDFVTAKDILKQQIHQHTQEYLANKLGLKNEECEHKEEHEEEEE